MVDESSLPWGFKECCKMRCIIRKVTNYMISTLQNWKRYFPYDLLWGKYPKHNHWSKDWICAMFRTTSMNRMRNIFLVDFLQLIHWYESFFEFDARKFSLAWKPRFFIGKWMAELLSGSCNWWKSHDHLEKPFWLFIWWATQFCHMRQEWPGQFMCG